MHYKDDWVFGKKMQRDDDNKCCNPRSKELYLIVSSLQAKDEVMLIQLTEASLLQGPSEFGISSHFSFDLW